MQNAPRFQRGLSIVELMVSVAISLAVLSALAYVYVGSRGAYRSNEALARVQEAGRFALDWVVRDLRQAGYMGCLSRGIEPVDYVRPPVGGVGAGNAVIGFERGAGWTNPTGIARAGDSDVLQLSGLLAGTQTPVWDFVDAVNAGIKVVDNCAEFKKDDVLMVANCERAALFKVTNVTLDPSKSCPKPAGKPAGHVQLTHAATGNGKNGIVDTHRISPPYDRHSRAFVARFRKLGYFIGVSPRTGRPGLYRYEINGQTEEVVNNVEDMDLLFGLDTDGDSSVDVYRKADAIAAADWGNVLSVRVSVLVVSDEVAATPGGQVVYLRDTGADTLPDAQKAADARLRQVFATTVALRNRLP